METVTVNVSDLRCGDKILFKFDEEADSVVVYIYDTYPARVVASVHSDPEMAKMFSFDIFVESNLYPDKMNRAEKILESSAEINAIDQGKTSKKAKKDIAGKRYDS